jgi:hypothetical protein
MSLPIEAPPQARGADFAAMTPVKTWTSRLLVALVLYLPAVALLLGAYALAQVIGFEFVVLTRDPVIVVTKEAPFYGGYLSSLGAVLWSTSAAICLFTASILRPADEPSRGMRRFLLGVGALSAMLLIDDLFMVHDGLLPALVGKGERTTLLVMGTFAVILLWRCRRTIWNTRYELLASALVLFAGSLVVDREIVQLPQHLHHLAEDGLKFVGIVGWCGYLVLTCTSAAHHQRALIAARCGAHQVAGEATTPQQQQ